MANVQTAIVILCLIAIILLIIFGLCYTIDFFTWFNAWLWSNREEKIGLTRSKGHYNANGYLVQSDSDIHLDSTGSFKRFDSVDGDYKIALATTSLTCNYNEWDQYYDYKETFIPPQPLRPAPVPISSAPSTETTFHVATKQVSNDELTCYEKTSISPIPRPVSSVSVAALASQSTFPVCISPPQLAVAKKQTMNEAQPAAKGANQPNVVQYEEVVITTSNLKRAISCDSICSDTSIALGDLEDFNVTGYLCIGLEYDSENCDLVVNVLEAKELQGTMRGNDFLDTYVRVFLLPDKEATIQTRIYRSSSTPSYKERFLFGLNPREQSQKSISFHLYATDMLSHTLIGEGELRLADISLRQPVTTWVTLTDTGQRGTEFGEIMFSLSYLPTAERLTVVVVKARNLKFENDSVGDSFVKVYLMQHGKKINKKKTSTKKAERSPIFNEAMMFSVPAHTLSTIQLRLTAAEVPTAENTKPNPIGHIIVGAQASGRSLSHWNQMLTALRKPVAMWHTLRK